MKATAVKSIRGTKALKGRSISADELRRLFDVCDPRTPGGARDAALLALLYVGGLRRHEAAGLDLADLDATGDTFDLMKPIVDGNPFAKVATKRAGLARRGYDAELEHSAEARGDAR